jgi:hypothetical protein
VRVPRLAAITRPGGQGDDAVASGRQAADLVGPLVIRRDGWTEREPRLPADDDLGQYLYGSTGNADPVLVENRPGDAGEAGQADVRVSKPPALRNAEGAARIGGKPSVEVAEPEPPK